MVHIFFDDKGNASIKKKVSPKLKKKASPKLKKKASPKLKKKVSPKLKKKASPKLKVSQNIINKYIDDFLILNPQNQRRECSPRNSKKSKSYTKKELVSMAKAIGITSANSYSKGKLCDIMKLDVMAL